MRRLAAGAASLVLSSLVLGLGLAHGAWADDQRNLHAGDASLSIETASYDVRRVTEWVIETEDNQGLPFMIVDKINAQALAFDREGLLLGAVPVLLGAAQGDDSPPGIGGLPLSAIPPEDRITAAGRFEASRGENLDGKDILWVDYASGLSLHPVITTGSDRRVDRLATPTTLDNRISYGCINVPADFYETIVRPLFSSTVGIVYILPETRSIEDVFFT